MRCFSLWEGLRQRLQAHQICSNGLHKSRLRPQIYFTLFSNRLARPEARVRESGPRIADLQLEQGGDDVMEGGPLLRIVGHALPGQVYVRQIHVRPELELISLQ